MESKRIAWPLKAIVLTETPAVVDEQDGLTGKNTAWTEALTWFSTGISGHAQARRRVRRAPDG